MNEEAFEKWVAKEQKAGKLSDILIGISKIGWEACEAALASQEPVKCTLCNGIGKHGEPPILCRLCDGSGISKFQPTSPQAQPDLQDARRYQFIRKGNTDISGIFTNKEQNSILCEGYLDEAIDKAMKGK